MSTEHWDNHVGKVESKELKGWLDWEYIQRSYIYEQVSGDSNKSYLGYFIESYLKDVPATRALSLGCGGGNLERAMIRHNAAQVIDAYDSSPESIRLAQQLAEEEGMRERIRYEAQDINTMQLPPKSYSFVIAKMALHHFEQLEHVYEQITETLTDDGYFVFNEYIGPSRFQWTDLQLELMKDLLGALPEKLRWSDWEHKPIEQIERPAIDAMIAMDASESVRSAEIMPVLKEYFEVLDYKPYGGTLLHMVLTHIMPNFDLDNPDQEALLKLMFLFEKTLIKRGVIESDFAFVVARPLRRGKSQRNPLLSRLGSRARQLLG